MVFPWFTFTLCPFLKEEREKKKEYTCKHYLIIFCSVVCEKGWYRLQTNTCAACPQGTFQPSRGTSQCIPCGVGLTTASSGTIQRDQCEPGPVNECVTGSHQCHKHAECMDTENNYHCTCKAGYTGDGYNCTGE